MSTVHENNPVNVEMTVSLASLHFQRFGWK